MAIGANVEKLIKIDEMIAKGLEDEIVSIKEIYIELINGLRRLKDIISKTRFEGVAKESLGEMLAPARKEMGSFLADIAQLEKLAGRRFAKIRKHTNFLRKELEKLKDTLDVYGSAEKAATDFENNIIYEFKVTIQKDFEEDIEFNKRIEEALK